MTTISQGPLIQLVAQGSQNAHFNNTNNNTKSPYATSIVPVNFINNKLDVPRNGDTVLPLYIKSDKKIEYVDYNIGGSLINCFPLEFCNKLNNFETEKEDHFIYKIPDFFKDIILIYIQYNTISFHLKLQDNASCQATLYCKYSYLDALGRAALAHNPHNIIINNFQWHDFNIGEGNTEINLDRFNGLVKGFFIENIDIDKVNSIKLSFNNHTRFEYDKTMIELFTKKINEDLIYINLDDTNWDDFIFHGAANLSRLDTVQLKINSDIEQHISIKILTPNVLKYTSDVAGLQWVYTPNNCSNIIHTPLYLPIAKKLIGDTLCPIEYEHIGENDKYKTCTTCKKNFGEESINIWLKTNSAKICPLCRSTWTNFTTYINTDTTNADTNISTIEVAD
jgi:hypothetical protein